MKIKLSIFLVALLPFYAVSQDLIVTQNGDSLKCKITKETNKYISYNFEIGDQIGKSKILLNDVRAVKYNHYQTNDEPGIHSSSITNYSAARLALNAGLSYRTAPVSENISSSQQSIYEDLKSGYHFGGDLSVFITENLGFGAMFNSFVSKANSTSYGEQKTDILFIGPEVVTRLLNFNKNAGFITSFALGYVKYTYSNNGSYNQILGDTFGTALSLGYDFTKSKKVGLGIQLSIMSATLNKIQVKNGIQLREVELTDEKEGLGRIDLSVGLRF